MVLPHSSLPPKIRTSVAQAESPVGESPSQTLIGEQIEADEAELPMDGNIASSLADIKDQLMELRNLIVSSRD